MKKKKKKTKDLPAPAAKEKKTFNFKKAGVLLLWIVGAIAVYQLCNSQEWTFHLYAYPILVGILGGAFVLLNGGFSRELPAREDLPADMTEEEKDALLEKLGKRKEIAKKLLYPLIALLFAVFADLVVLEIGDMGWL